MPWEATVFVIVLFAAGFVATSEAARAKKRNTATPQQREFADAVPEPMGEELPRQQQYAPPPRQEPATRQEHVPQTSKPDGVNSFRQAFEILGIPPGRTTLSVARAAYRAQMAEYRPDKMTRLGKELRELAARNALRINLAIKFIEENCASRAATSSQPATRSSQPPPAETGPGTKKWVDQILHLKNAVPFRPFSIKTRQYGRVLSTSNRVFLIRYPDWVWLKDTTTIGIHTDNTNYTYAIPLAEIEAIR